MCSSDLAEALVVGKQHSQLDEMSIGGASAARYVALNPGIRAGAFGVEGEHIIVFVRIDLPGKLKLPDIVQTGALLGLKFCLGKRREKHCRQNGDNGDDNEEFDEGEGTSRFRFHEVKSSFASSTSALGASPTANLI